MHDRFFKLAELLSSPKVDHVQLLEDCIQFIDIKVDQLL